MHSKRSEFLLNAKKQAANAAMFVFLLTVSPTVYAMSSIERRPLQREATQPVVRMSSRRRALDRHYGITPIYFLPAQ